MPNIIVDYDNKQTRIYVKDQFGGNVLSEIKKMDEYFSSRDFICELLAQSKKRDNEYIECSDENYINNILACVESYTYESMFKNDNFIANMQTNRDDWIYSRIIKKSLHKREIILYIDSEKYLILKQLVLNFHLLNVVSK